MPGSDWFFAISKVRSMFEAPNRGTVLGVPGRLVAPLPDPLGGDRKNWTLLRTAAFVSKASFFELLLSKAHFLMLPKTMVAALRDNSNVRLSEDFPVDYPRAAADTVTEKSPRSASMQIPDASETITKAGADLGRDNVSPLYRYGALATIFHEMTHAWLWMHDDYDAEFQKLWADGVGAYGSASGVNGGDFSSNPELAFSEAASDYVRDRTLRWCTALSRLDVLLRNKPDDGDTLQFEVDGIVEAYDKEQQVYGVVDFEPISSPDLSPALRDAINAKVIDGLPLTMRFDDTPLAGLRSSLLSS
jgi:hypothetical protein